MYNNLSAVDYKALYAKYLEFGHQPGFFLDMANFKAGDRVLDLCSGVLLRIPHLALDRGAKYVFAVDPIFSDWTINRVETPYRSEGELPYNETGVIYLAGYDIQYGFDHWANDLQFEVVTCQQAINYWFNEPTIAYLSKLMVSGARFVFNTFNKKPSTHPDYKTYDIGGKIFGEAFYTVDSMVHHWQMRECVSPHYTIFRWIDRPEFIATLEKYFHVQLLVDYSTDVHICSKT